MATQSNHGSSWASEGGGSSLDQAILATAIVASFSFQDPYLNAAVVPVTVGALAVLSSYNPVKRFGQYGAVVALVLLAALAAINGLDTDKEKQMQFAAPGTLVGITLTPGPVNILLLLTAALTVSTAATVLAMGGGWKIAVLAAVVIAACAAFIAAVVLIAVKSQSPSQSHSQSAKSSFDVEKQFNQQRQQRQTAFQSTPTNINLPHRLAPLPTTTTPSMTTTNPISAADSYV